MNKPEPVKATCEGCKFWRANYRLPDTNLMDFLDHGACHRRAPLVTGGMMSPMSTIWPATHKHDWCGEFQPVTITPKGNE